MTPGCTMAPIVNVCPVHIYIVGHVTCSQEIDLVVSVLLIFILPFRLIFWEVRSYWPMVGRFYEDDTFPRDPKSYHCAA